MIRTLYGDVLLLIDFCMNFFILHTVGMLLHRKTRVAYILSAALLGGFYDLARLFVNGNTFFEIGISMAVGVLMCYITYGGYRFLKTVFAFFGIAALAGGSMIGVYYLFGSYHADLFGNIGGYAYSHIPLWLFGLLAAVSLFLSTIFSHIGRTERENVHAELHIEYGGRRADLCVLLDSGNLVREPISGKPVILLPTEAAALLLPSEVMEAIRRGDSMFLLRRRFRLISAAGMDGKPHVCYGFMPERLSATCGRRRAEVDAYLAVCGEASFDQFDGVMHPSCI